VRPVLAALLRQNPLVAAADIAADFFVGDVSVSGVVERL
jgi:hypothetical protein